MKFYPGLHLLCQFPPSTSSCWPLVVTARHRLLSTPTNVTCCTVSDLIWPPASSRKQCLMDHTDILCLSRLAGHPTLSWLPLDSVLRTPRTSRTRHCKLTSRFHHSPGSGSVSDVSVPPHSKILSLHTRFLLRTAVSCLPTPSSFFHRSVFCLTTAKYPRGRRCPFSR